MVDEPAVGVEDEHLRSPARAVGPGCLLPLVVEEGEGEPLLGRPLAHVVRRVAEVAGVRVHGDDPGPAFVVACDLVDPVLPGDRVRAVAAGEDHGHGLPVVVGEGDGRAVEIRQRELRRRIPKPEGGHAARI